MGYTPNKTFNTLSGDRRQLWYDDPDSFGAKVELAAAAHTVVELKSEIEKIREQIQNVE